MRCCLLPVPWSHLLRTAASAHPWSRTDWSLCQLVHQMPALAYSFQTFFTTPCDRPSAPYRQRRGPHLRLRPPPCPGHCHALTWSPWNRYLPPLGLKPPCSSPPMSCWRWRLALTQLPLHSAWPQFEAIQSRRVFWPWPSSGHSAAGHSSSFSAMFFWPPSSAEPPLADVPMLRLAFLRLSMWRRFSRSGYSPRAPPRHRQRLWPRPWLAWPGVLGCSLRLRVPLC